METLEKSLSEFMQMITAQADDMKELKNSITIVNGLISRLLSKLEYKDQDDRILTNAYMGCYDFSDFVTNARQVKDFDVDLLREWYDEQTLRVR